MLLAGVDYLMIDTYNYFSMSMRKLSYLFVCYFTAKVISLCQVNYCFLMFSEICKEYREF